MNLVNLLYLLLISPKSIYNSKTNKINKKNGYDWRNYIVINNVTLPINETTNIISKIKILYHKNNLLKRLESNISIYDKVKLAEDHFEINKVSYYNLTAGGLCKNWLFDVCLFDNWLFD